MITKKDKISGVTGVITCTRDSSIIIIEILLGKVINIDYFMHLRPVVIKAVSKIARFIIF